MTVHIFDDTLMQFINQAKESEDENQRIDFNIFTCHTQAIERIVQLITELFLSVSSTSARDALIKFKIHA